MSLVLTAHQPTFLPYLGTWAKIAKADLFCLFDVVPFERHSYANRVRIKTAQGPHWLTVPVHLDCHLDTPGNKIRIADNPPNWRRKHLRTIEMAYRKALYFDEVWPTVERIYSCGGNMLVNLNTYALSLLWHALGINTRFTNAAIYNFTGTKSALVLDMCQKLGATEYWFGSQGRDYADVAAFERAGIRVHFQDYRHPVYRQLHGAFVPGLSVIDLLFNEGPRSLEILRNG